MERRIQLGLLGCGTVGEGVLRLLRDNRETIEERLGAAIEIRRVVARDRGKPRAVPAELLTFELNDVLDDPDLDIVVEVMGGIEPAGASIRRAIEKNKHVVTANKALLAEQGEDLLGFAERQNVDLYFEAAVAGAVPIVRLLREAFAADRIVALRGIVNGTSNYILTRMTEGNLGFSPALAEAQARGFAEADPTLDVTGGDAAHKLAILATLAFGARVTLSDVTVEGIEEVTAADIRFAERFGYHIKPLAVARQTDEGLELRVHPALVPTRSVLGSIREALNAILIEGAMTGPCMISGLGAGAEPTAMSVVSDVVDVSRNILAGTHGRVPSRAFRAEHLATKRVRPFEAQRSRYYLRFAVQDRPGVLAQIAGLLGESEVSIEQVVQEEVAADATPVTVAMLTHEATEGGLRRALGAIAKLTDVRETPRAIRIEEEP